jgi:outer membrane protein assembly factor BamB
VEKGIAYFTGSEKDRAALFAFDAHTGRELWKLPVEDSFATSPLAFDGKLVVLERSGRVTLYSDETSVMYSVQKHLRF